MRDLLLSPGQHMLDNWAGLASDGQVYASAAALSDASSACLFWLHARGDGSEWLQANLQAILQRYVDARIVVLSNVPSQQESLAVMQLGVVGYCHAYSEAAVLAEVKAVVEHGGIWLGQELLLHLIGPSRQQVPARPQEAARLLQILTPREQEVARQAAQGLSNKEIARQLDITERTVKAHLSSSFERLGVKDRLQLALMLNDRTAS